MSSFFSFSIVSVKLLTRAIFWRNTAPADAFMTPSPIIDVLLDVIMTPEKPKQAQLLIIAPILCGSSTSSINRSLKKPFSGFTIKSLISENSTSSTIPTIPELCLNFALKISSGIL